MTINEIETQEDYDAKMYEYKMSPADKEKREKAIRDLKIAFPEFDRTKNTTKDEVLKDIKDGEADISDMGGLN